MVTRARRSQPGDRPSIENLHHRASFKIPGLWWWEEYLTESSFVVTERSQVINGVLFAWSDESPVAWVRVAALDHTLSVDAWLALSLPILLDDLRRHHIQYLAWMDYGGWAEPYLESHGFEPWEQVMTLSKGDSALPPSSANTARIRPALDADVPQVVAVDRAAFAPHWWQSAATVRRRRAATSHIAVAEVEETIVGYVEGEMRPPVAHVNRIAVHPDHQGRSIGAALLRDVLQAFWRRGVREVSLNTQITNRSSRQLYQRFGFKPTGDVIQAWQLEL